MSLSPGCRYVLGSRSPRRLELLSQIVPADRIDVLAPRSSEEAGFDGLSDWAGIESRLLDIARDKCDDVLKQLGQSGPRDGSTRIVITADTVVVVGTEELGLEVLGQPPDGPAYRDVVRRWFLEHYDGKTHVVATAFCVRLPDRPPVDRVVRSAVTFHKDVARWLDWYLTTGEPRGKAGGYAVQGAGSIFVGASRGA